jgi:hypothetical protein
MTFPLNIVLLLRIREIDRKREFLSTENLTFSLDSGEGARHGPAPLHFSPGFKIMEEGQSIAIRHFE